MEQQRIKTAYFIEYPRTVDELCRPHLLEAERAYCVVRTVTLAAIDYENFATDFLAYRRFLEDNAALCSDGEVIKCLLVRQWGRDGGLLVLPGAPQDAHVLLAALAK